MPRSGADTQHTALLSEVNALRLPLFAFFLSWTPGRGLLVVSPLTRRQVVPEEGDTAKGIVSGCHLCTDKLEPAKRIRCLFETGHMEVRQNRL